MAKLIYKDDKGTEYMVIYHYDGGYYPATQYQPEERPELMIDDYYNLCDSKTIDDVPDEVYSFIEKNQ